MSGIRKFSIAAVLGAFSLLAAGTAVPFSEGVIVDPATGRAYVMAEGGGVRAVSLVDGATVWFSAAAAKPVMLHDGVLTAQVDRGSVGSVLELARIDADDGELLRRDEIRLPAGVPVAVDDFRKTSFGLFALPGTAAAGGPAIGWSWQGQNASRYVDDRGLVRFVAGAYRASGKTAFEAAVRTPPADFEALRSRFAGHPAVEFDGTWVLAQRRPSVDGDAVTVHRRDSAGILPTVEIPAEGATARILSVDGRHLLASERLGQGSYRWVVYSTATGKPLTTFRHSRPAHRFLLRGDTALTMVPPMRRLENGTWNELPDRLVGLDVSTGAERWSVPLRDTRYRGDAEPSATGGDAGARNSGNVAKRATRPGRSRPSTHRASDDIVPRSPMPSRAAAGAAPNQQRAWTAEGPAPIRYGQVENIPGDNPVTGAVEQMLPHPTDPDVVYLGAVNGGVWKSTDATAANPTWVAQTDDASSLSIGAMAMDPAEPDRVLAGIGRFSSYAREGGRTAGLLYTTDGGASWDENQGPFDGVQITSVAWNDPRVVVAGRIPFNNTGNVWVGTAGPGGAFSACPGTTGAPVTDLAVDPADTARFYFAEAGSRVVRTDDFCSTIVPISGGNTELALDLSLTGGSRGRILLALGSAGRLYVLAIADGSPRSVWYTDDPTSATPTWTLMDVPGIFEQSGVVQGATQQAPIRITSPAHQLVNGDTVLIDGVAGLTEANGIWEVERIDADVFALKLSDGCVDSGAGCTTTPYGGGGTWQQFDGSNPVTPGGQGVIHASMTVDPALDSLLYVGGDKVGFFLRDIIGPTTAVGNLWRGDATQPYTNSFPTAQWEHMVMNPTGDILGGGTSNASAPHADSRDVVIDSVGNLLESDDGGPYRRTRPFDNMGVWESMIGNLQVNEMHDIAWDNVSGLIVGASQDTGASEQSAPGSKTWNALTLGDGDSVAVEDLSAFQSVRYSTSNRLGNARRRTCSAGNLCLAEDTIGLIDPATGMRLQTSTLYNGIFLHATDPDRLLITSGAGVFESFDQGDNLALLLNATIPSTQKAAIYGHPLDGELVYFADLFRMFHRKSGVPLTQFLTDFPAVGAVAQRVNDLAVDPADGEKLWVATHFNVFRVNDAGTAWEEVTETLDDLVDDPRWNAIVYVPDAAGDRVVVGGREGAWVTRVDDPTCWTRLGDGLPNVPVFDLEYDAVDDVLVAGTLGRGAWTLSDFSTIPNGCFADVQVDTIDPVPSVTATGVTVSYDFEIRNEGPVGATNVTVAFSSTGPTPNVTSLTASTGGCDLPSLTCTLGDLSYPGAATVESIAVELDSADAGVLKLTATVATDRTDHVPTNDSVTATTIVETAPECDIHYEGDSTGSLQNPMNWQGDVLPTPTQAACVGPGFDEIGGLNVRQFNSESRVAFNGMQFSETSTINNELNIVGGFNGGTGTLIARGPTTISGGSIGYGAVEVVPANGSDLLTLEGGSFIDGVVFTSRAFTDCCGSGIGLQDDSTLIFEAPVSHDQGNIGAGSPGSVINRAAYTFSSGTATVYGLQNEDTLNVVSGSLESVAGVHSGDFVVAAGGLLTFLNDTLLPSSSVTGDGDVLFHDGNAVDNYVQGLFATTGTVTIGNFGRAHFESNASMGSLMMPGGFVRGGGTLTVDGVVDCNFCSLGGTGTVVALGGLHLNGGIADGQRIVNAGNGTLEDNIFGLHNGAVFENTLNATFDLIGNNRFADSGPVGTILNAGLFRKTGGVANVQTIEAMMLSTGTIEVQVGTLGLTQGGVISGPIVVAPGAIFSFFLGTFDLAGDVSGGGELRFQSATLRLDGDITVDGDYLEYLTTAKSLVFDIGGTDVGTFDTLTVTGTATLGGTLEVQLTDGFTPQLGDSWTLLSAGTLVGAWSGENLPALPAGLGWQVTYGATDATLEVVEVAVAELILDKSVDDLTPTLGDAIAYTILVVNDGPDAAENVVITDTFPGGTLTGVSGSSTQGSCVGTGPVTCTVGTIGAGGSVTITIDATAAQVGMVTNTATVTSDTDDPNPATDSDDVTIMVAPPPTAEVTIDVTDTVDPIAVSGTASYQIVVANDGPDPATDVTVTATWAGVARSNVQTMTTQGACMGTGPITCDLGTIAPGGSATITITATADGAGLLTLDASATANEVDPTLPNEDSATTTVGPPGMANLRVVQTDTRDPVLVGVAWAFLVDVFNDGPDPAPDVMLTGNLLGLPVNVLGATPDQGSCMVGPPLTCDLGLIPASGKVRVRVDVVAANDGLVTHVVQVTAPVDDPSPGDNQAAETTRVDTGPAKSRYLFYGVEGNGSSGVPGALHRIDAFDGTHAFIGDPVTPGGLSGLAIDSAGVTYGSTISGFGTTSTLVTIDRTNGSPIQTIGDIVPTGSMTPISVGDLDWDPLRSRLIALRSNADGEGMAGEVYELDPATGAATLLGPSGSPPGSAGLGITPDGRYFAVRSSGGFKMREIDPFSAEPILEVGVDEFYEGLTGHPSNGLLYGSWAPSNITTLERDGANEDELLPGPSSRFSDLAFDRTPRDVEITVTVGSVNWSTPSDVEDYDLVSGDLGMLRAAGGDFSAAGVTCIGSQLFGTSEDISSENPAPGEARFYLVRARPGSGQPMTWDGGGERQWGSRDAEIASGGDCPD